MQPGQLLVPTLLALVAPLASPAQADPACAVFNWISGDTCTFEAPATEFAFGGIATRVLPGQQVPWVAVQVKFNGQTIASCYDEGTTSEAAICQGRAQAFAPTLTHFCAVSGSGGPEFHCVDPPPLPLPLTNTTLG